MLLIIIYMRTLSVGIFAILSSAAIFTWYTPSLTPGCRQHAAECRKHPSTSNQIPFSLRMCHCLIKHAFHCSSWNSVPRSIHTYLWNTSTHWSACTYHLSRCHTPHQLMAFLLSTYQHRKPKPTQNSWDYIKEVGTVLPTAVTASGLNSKARVVFRSSCRS